MNESLLQFDGAMMEHYVRFLREEEKSAATIEKYRRDVSAFIRFLAGNMLITKEAVIAYKKAIAATYRPASVNSMLAAINHFFAFIGRADLRVKALKLQRKSFIEQERELTLAEYHRLLETAEKENRQLFLVMETICATGIRVSELTFITAEAARQGHALVACKGKERVVFLPKKLTKKLLQYAATMGVDSGSLFLGKNGRPLNRTRIWSAMKALCKRAGVAEGKVFPHNLRHLFARCFYKIEKDLVHLADVLGHSDINTTRIYTRESSRFQERRLARLGLIT